ncbi:MAG: hypothetical protein R3Y59_04620 [bacterium]
MIEYLVDSLVKNSFLFDKTICDLHKPCQDNKCISKSKLRVVDFDEVKSFYCKQHSLDPSKSVDALFLSSNTLFFIEIKGWKRYLQYNDFKEEDVNVQIEKYRFSDKYYDSYNILVKYMIDANVLESDIKNFCALDKFFVVVTDVSCNDNPVQHISNVLNFLAETSISEAYCYNKFSEHIKSIDFNAISVCNKPIKQAVIYCKDFDAKLSAMIK